MRNLKRARRALADAERAIASLAKDWVPLTWEAFEDYRLGGADLSREEVELVRKMIAGGDPDEVLPASGLSVRERAELRRKLGLGPPKKGSAAKT